MTYLDKQTKTRQKPIGKIANARTLRLFKNKGQEKPLCQIFETANNNALDFDSIEYFKSLSEKSGIPYQALINLYL